MLAVDVIIHNLWYGWLVTAVGADQRVCPSLLDSLIDHEWRSVSNPLATSPISEVQRG